MDMTGEYYALVAGDSKVYTISSYIASIFEKSLDDLIAVEKNTEEIAEESVTETATEEQPTTKSFSYAEAPLSGKIRCLTPFIDLFFAGE